MFSVDLRTERRGWTKNYDEEDGSFTGSLETGKAERSRQLYESTREQSIVGGASTGSMGGRVYKSSPTDPTRSIEPHNPPWTS
jgi:hypothetical protein